jgi:hypothetical protein
MSYCQKKNQNYLNFSDPSQLPSKDYNTHYQNNNFNYINSNQQYVNQYPFQRKHNNEIINEYVNENPHYDKEEPKFQTENEKNINEYLNYIQKKQKLTERNSKNYLDYIINERKEKRARSPYIYYASPHHPQENQSSNIINENNYNNTPIYPKSPSSSLSSFYKEPDYQNKPILSLYSRSSRLNEVTNPNRYYNIGSKEYLKYKEQQRNYLNSNFEMMLNHNKKKNKDIIVNPYNKSSSLSELGDSKLQHNTILNPLPNYTYNKYFGNMNQTNFRRSASTGNLKLN